MMKGAGSIGHEEIKRITDKRDGKVRSVRPHIAPDPNEGYQDWHSIVGDDDLEDNPNT